MAKAATHQNGTRSDLNSKYLRRPYQGRGSIRDGTDHSVSLPVQSGFYSQKSSAQFPGGAIMRL
jgi:hypothetical protein